MIPNFPAFRRPNTSLSGDLFRIDIQWYRLTLSWVPHWPNTKQNCLSLPTALWALSVNRLESRLYTTERNFYRSRRYSGTWYWGHGIYGRPHYSIRQPSKLPHRSHRHHRQRPGERESDHNIDFPRGKTWPRWIARVADPTVATTPRRLDFTPELSRKKWS